MVTVTLMVYLNCSQVRVAATWPVRPAGPGAFTRSMAP